MEEVHVFPLDNVGDHPLHWQFQKMTILLENLEPDGSFLPGLLGAQQGML